MTVACDLLACSKEFVEVEVVVLDPVCSCWFVFATATTTLAVCVSFSFFAKIRSTNVPIPCHSSSTALVMREDNSCTWTGISQAAKALSGANPAAKTEGGGGRK